MLFYPRACLLGVSLSSSGLSRGPSVPRFRRVELLLRLSTFIRIMRPSDLQAPEQVDGWVLGTSPRTTVGVASATLSSRRLSPGSIELLTPAPADRWIPGTSPGMTTWNVSH